MRIVSDSIPRAEIREMAQNLFGDMVKGVVDVERGCLALDAELHADLETALLEQGSQQKHLWGINLYPDVTGPEWLEFDSMINIRPGQGNRSRGVEDAMIRDRIREIVGQRVKG